MVAQDADFEQRPRRARRVSRTALAWAQALAPLLAALISAGWHVKF